MAEEQSELAEIIEKLRETQSYYCDTGPNAGKTFVRLEGYLTSDEITLIRTLHGRRM